MNKNNKIKLIKIAVENALAKHSAENVDIVKAEETGCVDIIYHSRHNSFSIIRNVCNSDGLSESDIKKIADCYDIGYCW